MSESESSVAELTEGAPQSSPDAALQPRKHINIKRIKKKEAKRKNAERVALARKNETPEKRELRLAKARACSAARRQIEMEKNRKRKRERARKAKIREQEEKKKHEPVQEKPKSGKLPTGKVKVVKNPSALSSPIVPNQAVPKNLDKPLLKKRSTKSVMVVKPPSKEVNSPPITGCRPNRPTSVDVPKLPEKVKTPSQESLEKLHKEQLEREAMRPLLRAQFSAIYQNFCVSQQNLTESIQLAIVGVQIPLIEEEIPNYFDVLIPGFLIRKMKYTLSNVERNTIHGNTFISHQFYSFFKFLFGKMKNGTTMSQVIVDPRLIEVFSFRFPLEELWRRTMEEAVSHHFDVIYTFDPENRMVVPVYRKKKSLLPKVTTQNTQLDFYIPDFVS